MTGIYARDTTVSVERSKELAFGVLDGLVIIKDKKR